MHAQRAAARERGAQATGKGRGGSGARHGRGQGRQRGAHASAGCPLCPRTRPQLLSARPCAAATVPGRIDARATRHHDTIVSHKRAPGSSHAGALRSGSPLPRARKGRWAGRRMAMGRAGGQGEWTQAMRDSTARGYSTGEVGVGVRSRHLQAPVREAPYLILGSRLSRHIQYSIKI